MQPRPVTEESMWKTLEKVGIADLIRSFPNGLDTELKSSDSHMSGGQTQKLLIARAIISEPSMLILDEATSALDNVSQQEIKDVLDAMNCTRIVVAHRLSTIRDCDRILLLDDGIISQEGTYEELMAYEEYRDWITAMNDTKAPPNGECIRDFRTRVIRGFEEVRRRHSIRTLELRHHEEDALSIVICHGGTISAIMNYIWPGVHDNMYGWLPEPGHGYILHLIDDAIKEYERF